LEKLNEAANEMFEKMKGINRLVNQKLVQIELTVTKAEDNFSRDVENLLAKAQRKPDD